MATVSLMSNRAVTESFLLVLSYEDMSLGLKEMCSERMRVVRPESEEEADENDASTASISLDHTMEELRKRDAKSIVSQRLALFRALERSRPRNDDGSPMRSNCVNFIYNSRLSKDIVSDFQLVNSQKSPNRQVAFDELLKERPTPKSTVKHIDMDAAEGTVPALSVRQLRSLFEGSSMRLTARNSAEEDRAQIPREERSKEAVQAGAPNSLTKQNEPRSGTVANDFQLESKCEPTYVNTMPHALVEQAPEDKKSTIGGTVPASSEDGTKPIVPERPSKLPTPSKPWPPSPSDSTASKGMSNKSASRTVKSFCTRPAGATGTSLNEPSFKIDNRTETPPEFEKKWATVPMKQRTLGRGEIKPYEIVNLVNEENDGAGDKKETRGEDQAKEKPGKFRMESMYVDTGGMSGLTELNNGLKDAQEDGYQEIPEFPDAEQELNMKLDADEWDLSNLGNNNTKNTLRMAELEGRTGRLSGYEGINDSRMRQDENRNHFGNGTLLSNISCDSRDSTLSSSCLSEITEESDSDEFDQFTDDEVLDDRKRTAKTSDVEASKKKIWNIVNEILATEKAYTKRLHLLEKFQSRLLKEAKESNVVPEKVVQEIFSNLSSICTFHSKMLLPDLEKRITNWSSNEKIGDIFKTLGHCLKLYTAYVKNFDHATTTLNQWMKRSPKFASIIDELQKQPECEHLTLQHHMLGPIQRVPRYRLLLQDYLKKLPKDSPDRAEAEESLSVISEAANHSNNSMKGMEQFKKLVEIEERILEGLQGESLATASRVFIKEGELMKIAARSDQRQARILLLFNDLVLCCNKIHPVGKLKVRQMMEIPGMTVQDMDEDMGEPHAFRIRSRQRVLDLAASNKEEKEEWVAAILNAIREYEAKRGSVLKQHLEQEAEKESDKMGGSKVGESAPVWVKDEDVTMCMLCAVRFSLLSRRHHCRACGRIVCDNCSKFKAQLSYMNNTVKRVCYVCHKKLNADRLQETDSFIQKSLTLAQVNRDPKRRRSTLVTEIKGELTWKAPGKGWVKGYFSVSDMVLYVQKGKKDPKAQMTIALPGYTVARPSPADEIDESKHPHTFKLYFGSKKDMTYYFRADTEELTQRWIDVITYSTKAEKPPPQYKTL